jgi:hypothetical protein
MMTMVALTMTIVMVEDDAKKNIDHNLVMMIM